MENPKAPPKPENHEQIKRVLIFTRGKDGKPEKSLGEISIREDGCADVSGVTEPNLRKTFETMGVLDRFNMGRIPVKQGQEFLHRLLQLSHKLYCFQKGE